MDFSGSSEKQLLKGTHRVCTPEETLARVLPMKHRFGITRVANVTGLDSIGIPVVIAIRPNARSVAVSQGKGATLNHAKASAVMEAIEIWHAENIDTEVFFASAADLKSKHDFVDLDRLPQTSGAFFDAHMRMHWVAATDLMSGQQKLVPLEMVHADYTHPVSPEAGSFAASTNGLASGNHLLEAICHGICEVVERDALAVWHHLPLAEQKATRLDVASIDDEAVLSTLAKFKGVGLECVIWDVTSDVGVASYQCVIYDPNANTDHLGLGSGTHPDRVTALHRTLNEAAQTRLNYISGAREDLSFEEYSVEGRREKMENFQELLGDHGNQRRFDDVQSVKNKTILEDLNWLKKRLANVGIEELAVVDLTRQDVDIPVVRVVIPGLEAAHDDLSYVSGPRARAAGQGEHLA